MRVVYLPLFWTIILDSIAWGIIQPLNAYIFTKIPIHFFDEDNRIFRTRKWEGSGTFYQKYFRIKKWKKFIPSGGRLFGGFSMSRLSNINPNYISVWIKETCRSELCHWTAIMPSIFFFLWNPVYLSFIMVVYALLFNLPLIMIQRYNRPRFINARQERFFGARK